LSSSRSDQACKSIEKIAFLVRCARLTSDSHKRELSSQ
jgi:hypothetical protein